MIKEVDENRVITLNGEVNTDSAIKVINKLLLLDKESTEDITLQICSPGGDVDSALAIIDVMQKLESHVRTVGLIQCCSASSLILAAGEKKYRTVNKNCLILLHQGQGGLHGKIADINTCLKEFNRKNEIVLELYSQFTGVNKENVRKDLQKDLILTAEQAVSYGLIDNII